MDLQFREMERAYRGEPSTATLFPLLNYKLRAGIPIELADDSMNTHWDDPKLREFLSQVPRLNLSFCGNMLRKWAVTRTPLMFKLHNIIADNFDEGLEETPHEAHNDEFSVMHTAYSPNGENAGQFLILALHNDGFSEHHVEYDCNDNLDDADYTVNTTIVAYWSDGLDYNNFCGYLPGACDEDHIGTEEHINEIDMMRATEVETHFDLLLESGDYEDFLDLKMQGY